MNDLLEILNMNAALISAVSTAAIAALTAVLWFENRSLRKAGTSPEVVCYLSPHPDGNGAVNVVIANVGKGPAFNISFEILHDEADFAAHDAMFNNDSERTPISVLPQDEKLRVLWGLASGCMAISEKRI